MAKIFITGARGFIGRNLVEFLAEDAKSHSLFYPYHDELELLDENKVLEFIDTNKIDIIVHCASVGGSRKTGYDINKPYVIEKNLRMFFNLAKAQDKIKCMINLGSGAEYDRQNYQPKMREDYFDSHTPTDGYGFSKYVCSKYITNSKNIVNLRLFGVFGKHEDYRYRFISNAIVKNLLGLPIVINKNVYFDYLYVKDLVKIIEYFINNKAHHKNYNVTTGKVIDLVTIANMINELSEKPSEIIVKNQGLNPEYSGDNSRLCEEVKLGFTSFIQALGELYNWYKSTISTIDKQLIEKDEFIKYCR